MKRSMFGLKTAGVWYALVILVVGVGLISVGLWLLGWPVLVTGGY